MRKICLLALAAAFMLAATQSLVAAAGGPQLGSVPSGGPAIDKSGDQGLQKLIKEVAPKFRQLEYKDAKTGKSMAYSLFEPQNMKEGEKYPLVLFMADASTPGKDATRPLTQGYGALVFAAPDLQAKHPCYVVAPQFSGVAVNDAYERTDEVDMVARLIADLAAAKNIDQRRVYTTGQSMGGMISMYFNIAYPQMFAASLFVDCHWDTGKFLDLAKQNFIFIAAGDKGKAYANIEEIENAARKCGRQYTFASWSARLPQATQDDLAQTMLDKGAPINIFEFETGTVIPEGKKGSEHMYSFDAAYKLNPALEWLFKYEKSADWLPSSAK